MSNIKHKTMLSEHFSLEELTYSRIAVENGLDNEPSPACPSVILLSGRSSAGTIEAVQWQANCSIEWLP